MPRRRVAAKREILPDPKFGSDSDLLRCFYDASVVKVSDGRSVPKIENKIAVDDVVYPLGSDRAGEIIVEAGHKITKNDKNMTTKPHDTKNSRFLSQKQKYSDSQTPMRADPQSSETGN